MNLLQMPSSSPHRYSDGRLEIDYDRAAVCLDGARLVMTRKEFELLSFLTRNAGEIVPRAVLLMQVWGYGAGIRTRTLDVHIRRLRKKLAAISDRYIETIFGVGYRFQPFREPAPVHRYAQSPAVAARA
jgi:DNA-binding response OmpR family regulator